MSRTGQASLLAIAALSGGAAVSLAPDGQPAARTLPTSFWAKPSVFRGIKAEATAWSVSGRRAILWTQADALNRVKANADCKLPARSSFAIVIPIADPLALDRDGAAVTLRYHVADRTGWVRSELSARVNDGRERRDVSGTAMSQGTLTVFAPPGSLRTNRGVHVAGVVKACGREGGRGEVHLDSIEVAA